METTAKILVVDDEGVSFVPYEDLKKNVSQLMKERMILFRSLRSVL